MLLCNQAQRGTIAVPARAVLLQRVLFAQVLQHPVQLWTDGTHRKTKVVWLTFRLSVSKGPRPSPFLC